MSTPGGAQLRLFGGAGAALRCYVAVGFLLVNFPSSGLAFGGFSNPLSVLDALVDTDTEEPEATVSEEDVGDLGESLNSLHARFAKAMSDIFTANSIILEATGMQDEADKYRAEASSLTQGACATECVKRAMAMSEEANQQAQAQIEKAGTVDAAAKAKLSTATPAFTSGTLNGALLPAEYASWIARAQSTVAGVQSNPLMLISAASFIAEVPVVATVTTKLPSLLSSWRATSRAFSNFAKANDIDVGDLEEQAKEI